MIVLFAVTMFVAGSMLFLVQPMFARMVLPLFGGSPAVWNTAMLFYQVALLAGYLYAHGSRRWLTARQQVVVHLVVLALPLLVLPIGIAPSWIPDGGENPVPALLGLLLVGAGLPFFVVSSTSPLLQSWFSRGDHPSASRPYALYAASNAGSMLALLGYPFLIEPRLALAQQTRLWSLGYGALALLIAGCALQLWRVAGRTRATPLGELPTESPVHAALTWPRRLRWVTLAFVPSSLMLSVTMYMSTNIAPLPLLWVIPLAIYLLTFTIAFASRRIVSLPILRRLLPFVLLPLLIAILSDASQPIKPLIALHLVAFGIVALLCHGALADDVPPASQATEFYIWLSVGGALGGVFNALLAPHLFSSVLEYPLVLALAAAVIVPRRDGAPAVAFVGRAAPTRAQALDLALPIALGAVVLLLDLLVRQVGITSEALARLLTFGVATMLCFGFAERPLRFGLGIAAITVVSHGVSRSANLLYAERSFFGVSRVQRTLDGRYNQLVHGNISHGSQSLDSARRHEPLTYYTASGPAGKLIRDRQATQTVRQVVVVGLGAGSLACYRRPGETWTFYEIDPVVLRIARDPRFFTFMQACAPDARVVLGDARLSLASADDGSFDVLVLDAYSGDAVPVHLITREALALYRRKLAPGGVIVMHVSNLYFDLAPIVADLVTDAGMVSHLNDDASVSLEQQRAGKLESEWIVIAEPQVDLRSLLADPSWRRQVAGSQRRVWTDDFSSTLSALR
ncbi:MAG: fused MFS/spermidine synthase [Gemmatimonadota bacterium]